MKRLLAVLLLFPAVALAAQTADLQIASAEIAKRSISVGSRFTVTMEWTNTGPDTARDILVTLTSNGGLVLTGGGTSHWPCEPSLGSSGFECRGAEIAPGGRAHMVVSMLAPSDPESASLQIVGRISSSAADPDTANNVRELVIDLSPAETSAAVSLSGAAPEYRVVPGESRTIPLTVRNDGPAPARNVTLVFAYAPGTRIPVTAEGTGWTCGNPTHSPWIGVCKREQLEAGTTSTVTVSTTAPLSDGSYPFAARVAAEAQANPIAPQAAASSRFVVGDVPQPEPVQFRRLLVPLTGADVPGANGSLWRTETTALIASDEPIEVLPASPAALPLRRSFDARAAGLIGGSATGQFLYIPAGDENMLRINSRVYDVARETETAGSEIPIVPEGRFTSDPVVLVGVPLAPQYRHTLRIYDFDGRDGTRVAVRLYADGETVPRVSSEAVLRLPPDAALVGELPVRPAYAQLDPARLTSLDGVRSLRIEVQPLDAAVRIWTFVSLTNNDTHHVTTLSAR